MTKGQRKKLVKDFINQIKKIAEAQTKEKTDKVMKVVNKQLKY